MSKTNRRFELNSDRLSEIIGSAVFASAEVVNLHFSLSVAIPERPPDGLGVIFNFRGPELNPDQRRAMHEGWILGKAFQELLRAVRHALEEAHVMTALITKEHKVRSTQTLEDFVKPFQRKAAGLRFPELLDPKLDFSDSYESLQIARNYLEHRAGIVSHIETRGTPFFNFKCTASEVLLYERAG